MNRELDTLDVTQELSTTWSDYDGNDIYGDFEIDGFGDVVEFRSFEPGIGTVAPWIDGGVSNTTYYHTGLLGSTRGTSAPDGTGALTASYSAFGIMGSTQPLRYGFAGA